MAMLSIKDLSVTIGGKPILNGLNLEVGAGEVHAIMGPNGSGKSTLAHVLAGRPGNTITSGTVHYLGQDLLALAPEERARQGLFLGFQYPVEIPGVNNVYLLKAAVNAVRRKFDTDTPGTSTGYCMARNSPALARASTLIASTSSPSRVTDPWVTRYLGWPAIA